MVNYGQKSFITLGPVLEKVFLVTNGFTRIQPQDVVAGYVGRAAVSGLQTFRTIQTREAFLNWKG